MAKSRIEILDMIAEDMRSDAQAIDGLPFDGKTVAKYFGQQAAAIEALANIMMTLVPTGEEGP
jgi:hypothetical protein